MIAVTGATGRIGNVLVKRLVEKGEEVRCVVRKTSDQCAIGSVKLQKAIADIRDLESLTEAFRNVSTVYHLASLIWIKPGGEEKVMDINVGGTKNVIKACLTNKVQKLVYMSSIHALKEPPVGTVIDESCPFHAENPRGVYDRSKAMASIEVQRASQSGLETRIICPTGVTGPYDYRPSYFGKSLINFAQGKQKIYIKGAYDYVDVRDVAKGAIQACKAGKNGETYILSGEQMNMDDFYKYLEEFTGVKAPTRTIPYGLALAISHLMTLVSKEPEFTPYSLKTLVSNSKISHKKASKHLGYSPRSVKDSIRDQFEWFKKQGMI